MFSQLTDLDLRLIRVFLAIVDAGGVTPAQATLNIGQSTISTQLATLETRLGYRLCERGRGGFPLTARGGQFDHDAQRHGRRRQHGSRRDARAVRLPSRLSARAFRGAVREGGIARGVEPGADALPRRVSHGHAGAAASDGSRRRVYRRYE